MEYKDYYKVLGLDRTVPQDEIKRTYRKLARKFHPDINKDAGAEDKFKDVGEAYAVLGDIEKRAAYDQLGREWQAGQDFRPPPNWDAGYEFSGPAPNGAGPGMSDFFETLFGRMSGGHADNPRRRPEYHARGEDHHAKIEIDVRDTFAGATRSISLRMPETDDNGHVRLRERTLAVKIPKGVVEGQPIRLKGQGSAGYGSAPAGDLYLELHFKPDAVYRVAGHDLFVDLPIAPWEAALGAEVEMPTPVGSINLKIPAGSVQGRQLRIRGRGIPSATPGDLYAVLHIVLPPADTEKAKKFYADMASELAFDPRSGLKSKQGA